MTNPTQSADMADRRPVLGFTWGYWMLNSIEMFERLAYYLVRSVVASSPSRRRNARAARGTAFVP